MANKDYKAFIVKNMLASDTKIKSPKSHITKNMWFRRFFHVYRNRKLLFSALIMQITGRGKFALVTPD